MITKLTNVKAVLLITAAIFVLTLCAAFPDTHTITAYQKGMIILAGLIPLVGIGIAISKIDKIIVEARRYTNK